MPDFLLLSEVADKLGVRPSQISYLFQQRILDRELCPLRSQRRLIPTSYVAVIKQKLAEMGKLPAPKKPARKTATA